MVALCPRSSRTLQMGIAGMTSPREPMKKNRTFFLPFSAIAGAEKPERRASPSAGSAASRSRNRAVVALLLLLLSNYVDISSIQPCRSDWVGDGEEDDSQTSCRGHSSICRSRGMVVAAGFCDRFQVPRISVPRCFAIAEGRMPRQLDCPPQRRGTQQGFLLNCNTPRQLARTAMSATFATQQPYFPFSCLQKLQAFSPASATGKTVLGQEMNGGCIQSRYRFCGHGSYKRESWLVSNDTMTALYTQAL